MPVSTFGSIDFNSPTSPGPFPTLYGDMSVLARIAAAFAPHETAPPSMKVAVDAGAILVSGQPVAIGAQSTGVLTAPLTNSRIDRVAIDYVTGAISVVTGTEAANPVPPAIPAGLSPVARIQLSVGMQAISNARIDDERLATPSAGASASGRLLGVQTFTADGTYNATPGTSYVIVDVLGGGAGGGGCAATGASQVSVGGGGGAGSYGRGMFTSGFDGVAVTVGASVAAGSAGATGSNGHASSFGSLLVAPGGFGGTAGSAVSPPTITWGSNGSLTATGANLVMGGGESGFTGIGLSNSNAQGGRGGASVICGGGSGTLNGGPGSGGTAPVGSGGGGASNLPSSAARSGGPGAGGLVVVYEYS
jgi:hypothetical protein